MAHSGSYGLVSHLSEQMGVSRQTLYSWQAKGEAALEQAARITINWFIRIFADTGLPEKIALDENSLVEQSSEV